MPNDKAKGQGHQGQGTDSAPGQQKMHTLTNAQGETRQVTQAEWRQNRQQLQSEGWYRPGEDDAAEDDGETTDAEEGA